MILGKQDFLKHGFANVSGTLKLQMGIYKYNTLKLALLWYSNLTALERVPINVSRQPPAVTNLQ
jgi:hypothetical protein